MLSSTTSLKSSPLQSFLPEFQDPHREEQFQNFYTASKTKATILAYKFVIICDLLLCILDYAVLFDQDKKAFFIAITARLSMVFIAFYTIHAIKYKTDASHFTKVITISMVVTLIAFTIIAWNYSIVTGQYRYFTTYILINIFVNVFLPIPYLTKLFLSLLALFSSLLLSAYLPDFPIKDIVRNSASLFMTTAIFSIYAYIMHTLTRENYYKDTQLSETVNSLKIIAQGLDHSTQGFVITDTQWAIEETNKAFDNIVVLPSNKKEVNLLSLFSKRERGEIIAKLQKDKSITGEYTLDNENQRIPVSLSLSNVYHNSIHIGNVAVFRDITKEKEQTLHLSQAQSNIIKTLQKSSNTDITHAILNTSKNFLSSIKNKEHLIEEIIQSPTIEKVKSMTEQLESYKSIQKTIEYSLVNDLYNSSFEVLEELKRSYATLHDFRTVVFEKITQTSTILDSHPIYNTSEADFEVLRIDEILEDVLLISSDNFDKYSVKIEKEITPVPHMTLSKSKLFYIFSTLIDSTLDSFKESHNTGKYMTIKVFVTPEAIFVELHNNGMSSPDQLSIFKEKEYSSDNKHHSFNLYTVKQYIESMSGKIESIPTVYNRGSAFKITFTTTIQ